MSEEEDLEAKPWAEPKSLSFADVNDFVFEVDRHFEELQGLCLTLACDLDKRPSWRSPPKWIDGRWSEPWPVPCVVEMPSVEPGENWFFTTLHCQPINKNWGRARRILPLTESTP